MSTDRIDPKSRSTQPATAPDGSEAVTLRELRERLAPILARFRRASVAGDFAEARLLEQEACGTLNDALDGLFESGVRGCLRLHYEPDEPF